MLNVLAEPDFYHQLSIYPVAIVFFTRQGCSSCIAWQNLLEQYIKTDHALPVFKVDVEHALGLVNEYALFHLPALFLFKEGEFHGEIQAEARLPVFIESVDKVFISPAQEAP